MQQDLFRAPDDRRARLGQWFTPCWLSELLVERYFPELDNQHLVLEPTCGPGSLLAAVPEHVPAIGIEIDPALAAAARRTTGRHVIDGDFRVAALDLRPTHIIGNPPFEADLIEDLLTIARRILPEGGRAGLLLPAYYFQTSARLCGLAESWSITTELVPRDLFPRLSLPLCFATFSRDRRRALVGLALYRECQAVANLPDAYRRILAGEPTTWRAVVEAALQNLGGAASLRDLYTEIEGHRPSPQPFWRDKVRQTLQRHFRRIAPATYGLAA